MVPSTEPEMEPRPPKMTMIVKSVDLAMLNMVGLMNWMYWAMRAPATPAKAALTTRAIILCLYTSTPAIWAASSSSRTATMLRPWRELIRFQVTTMHTMSRTITTHQVVSLGRSAQPRAPPQ
jgi:hypothetical protein